MKIGTNVRHGMVYIYFESSYEEVIVRAFATKHKLPLRLHNNKRCLALEVPGQRILLHEFIFSSTSEAMARQVFDDIVRRLRGEDRPDRTYGCN